MSRLFNAAMLSAIAALALSQFAPANATSLYQMNGQGSITIGGGGIPACLPVVQQGNCHSPNNSFSWGELTVQGAGLLQGAQVAGQYKCASEGIVPLQGSFESRIYGNTSNFELTFNFTCTPEPGAVGPAHINGWFSNVTDNAVGSNPAFHNVSSHPFPTPTGPGLFSFKGYFTTQNINPYNVNTHNGDPMACGGGFAPNNFNQTDLTIPTAAFLGTCQAVAA
ncbi:MAG: hypothetical protein ACYDCC_14390 [Actinomycetota bacterium]